jgi:hypothetical protein
MAGQACLIGEVAVKAELRGQPYLGALGASVPLSRPLAASSRPLRPGVEATDWMLWANLPTRRKCAASLIVALSSGRRDVLYVPRDTPIKRFPARS